MNRHRAARFGLAAGLALGVLAAAVSSQRLARADVPIAARGDRLVVLPAHRTVRAGAARYRLDALVPAQPYAEVRESEPLQGFVATPPLVFDDGSLIVGVSSPPGLAWVQADGHLRSTARLDDRPAGDLAIGADGRIFASAEARSVFMVAPDGTVRGSIPPEPSAAPIPGPIVREDGSVVLLSNGGTVGIITFLSPAGERVGSRTVPMRIMSASLGPDGCVWVVGSTGVACLDGSGQLRDAPFGRGANLLVPISETALALVSGPDLQIRTPRGELRGRANINAPVQWVTPLASGGVVVLRTNPAQELLVLGPDATVVAHIPFNGTLGARWLGVLSDADGAIVGVSSAGIISAYEPDGTERWHMQTRWHFTRPPVPLRGGGFVVPIAEGGGLLFVR